MRSHLFFFFSSRRRHTRFSRDWSSDVCSSDLPGPRPAAAWGGRGRGGGRVSASQPRHPFTIAWEIWQAWSDAEAMRTARRRTAARGESLAVFDQHPEWTQGPGTLAALAANREVVEQLVGWRFGAMREAREQGLGWAELGAALGVDAEQARQVYLERVE